MRSCKGRWKDPRGGDEARYRRWRVPRICRYDDRYNRKTRTPSSWQDPSFRYKSSSTGSSYPGVRGELFLLLQQVSELVVELFHPETISHDCGIVFIPLLCQGSGLLSEACVI